MSLLRGRDAEVAAPESQATPLRWVSVRDQGALGNNVADDTDAIRRAIAAAIASKQYVVYFPAGNYRISGTLTLGDVVSLVGDGADATVIRHRGTGNAISLIGTVRAQVAKTNIRDLSIFGDGSNSEIGLALSFAPYGTYQNLRIHGFRTGVSVEHSWNLSFLQVTAESCRQDGWRFGLDANNVGMKNCVGLKCAGAGYYISGPRGLALVDCNAEENLAGVVIAAAQSLASEKISILGGYYEGNTSEEISIRSDGGGIRPKAVSIRDAYFVHTDVGGALFAAIRVRAVQTLVISGCHFSARGKGYQHSLYLHAGAAASGVVWDHGNLDESSGKWFKGLGTSLTVASATPAA